ncbi:PilN domain-containing protein [Bradyrhizobium sp. ISRA442]|uniref:PilN domain-containing protein n=1 Tax=Bradyrhizobium sp. ISRA442 TaxID=2866197 RepID=UPI00311AC214
MKLATDIEAGLAAWSATVAAAIEQMADRLQRRRQISARRNGADTLTLRVAQQSRGKPPLPDVEVRLADDRALPADWIGGLRGCAMDIHLAPHEVLVRQLDFPKQAEPFLDGMVRSQIDRLTPWTADQAFFGLSAPQSAPNERIGLILAAVPRAAIVPLVQFADRAGAAAVAINADDGSGSRSIMLFKAGLRSAIAGGRDLAKLLKFVLLGVAATTAVTLVATMLLGTVVDGELQDLRAAIARQRAALRLSPSGGASTAETLLARRKQTTPANVLALDHLSKLLPDGTYVTDLRIEGDRLQLAGLTQDAPTLIRLIEQSPQFSRATFYAPTTRSPNEPGERFHIEAHVNAYFGEGA